MKTSNQTYRKGDHGLMHWPGAPGPGCATYRCKGSCDRPGTGAGAKFQSLWQKIEPLSEDLKGLKKRHSYDPPVQIKEKISFLQKQIDAYKAKIEEIKEQIKRGTFKDEEQVQNTDESKEHNYYDTKDSEHKWAKHSEIKNVGDDLDGSARHKRNANRDWQSLDDLTNATAEQKKLITKKKLDELYAVDFVAIAEKATHPEMALGMKEYLAKFVSKPGYMNPDDYIQDYKWLQEKVKEVVGKDLAVMPAIKELRTQIRTRYYELKKELSAQGHSEQNWYRLNHFVRLNNANIERAIFMFRRADLSFDATVSDLMKESDNKARVLETLKAGGVKKTGGRKKPKDEGPKESDFYKNIKLEFSGGVVAKTAAEAQEDMVNGYGIVGLQYGNSLSDEERASFTINADRSLEDLKEVYGLSKNQVSFGRSLGLSFGARGKPGSIAHYDPALNLLSFNRRGGTGALAHEWGHGLDYKIRGSNNEKAKEKFSELRVKIRDSKFYKRLLQEEVYKSLSYKKRSYWSSDVECFARCFEKHTELKLSDKGKKNTFLVAGVDSAFWPTKEEMSELSDQIDSLMEAFRQENT